MINNYFTLQTLIADLSERLTGKTLVKILSDPSHRVYFVFENDVLIVHIGPGKKYIYLQPQMKKFPVPSYPLFKQCHSIKLNGITLVHSERIVCLSLHNGWKFFIYLYSPVENIVLHNESISFYFDKKKHRFDSLYTDHSQFAHNPATFDDVEHIITTIAPLNQPQIKAELERRMAISPSPAKTVQQFLHELNSPSGILAWPTNTKVAVPQFFPYIPGNLSEEFEPELIDTPNRAIQIVVGHSRKAAEFNKIYNVIHSGLKYRQRYLQKSIKDIQQQLRNREKRKQYTHQANLIKWNLHRIKKGMSEIVVPDYENNMTETIIRLNPQMEPEEFAKKLYDKAKRLENMPNLEQRLQLLNNKKQQIDHELEKLDTLSDIKSLKKFHRQLLEKGLLETDLKGHTPGRSERSPYREYRSGLFRYRVGKSAAESDFLTLKLSRKTDWFFHAQDIKGSHVVVSAIDGRRLEKLPKEVIERASILASYYSVAKNSQYVPVQYIQIRYIRKPRGAPPGTVVFNRYESVFAEPAKYTKLTFDI